MRGRLPLLALRTLGALAALAALASCGARPTSGAACPIGTTIPPLELSSIDGRRLRVRDEVAGKPALIALWATWCDPCVRELDALDRLALAAAPRGGVVVGVSVGEDEETVRAFLTRRPVAFVDVLDPSLAFARALDLVSLPAVVVLDREGRVVYAGETLDRAALTAFRAALGVRE